ncbi:MAG: RNA 2',3'-cyclic phosphodiesterase [Cyanobacteria bacterium HKST-UBA02]|nr:RNA 2',3'-cyclic phosphodiesterase [Cyanobacteria bacterium HKST-UBA02]
MPRLFVGTFLNDEERSRFTGLREENKHLSGTWGRKVAFVEPEKIHITWLFLGDIEKRKIGTLASRLESAGSSKEFHDMMVTYDRLEIWPSPQRARLGVLTANLTPAPVQTLAGHISGALKEFGPETEHKRPKAFKPHLTLMRLRAARHETDSHLARPEISEVRGLEKVIPLNQNIDRICLIESELGDGPPQYRSLVEIAL